MPRPPSDRARADRDAKNGDHEMKYHVLCINGGSSSLKFAIYQVGETERLTAYGAVEAIGEEKTTLWVQNGDGSRLEERSLGTIDHEGAVKAALEALDSPGLHPFDAAGHRLVHGGPLHEAPEKVTPELIADLQRLVPLAPLHLPTEIQVIQAVTRHYPLLPQVVCFDTAFHRRMPELAQRLPLPRALWDEGIHKYGFHGLSYEYVLSALSEVGRGRVIIAHLGNGASMVALTDGRPLDTTMGLTPIGGLMMGRRPGDLDPGVLLYLVAQKGYDASRLERLLDQESGLIGVSGISGDMKTLLDAAPREPHAAQAVDMFCYQARKTVGALAAVLGGLDLLVFTGGIGERAAPVRAGICHGLEHLGIQIDVAKNSAHADVISREDSNCVVRVVHTNEDLMIARHTQAALLNDTRHTGE